MACMNDKVLVSGRCDYCDIRCPFYTTKDALVSAIYARLPSEIAEEIVIMAHNRTMNDLESAVIKYNTEV